ncbi:DUF1016 N-terminal domain-containing protein [Adlercreutzia sp. ZJ176]|nr:DUF1016 N-terminal domain-containing protein [Adlercreutzia sp. ZJ176]
MELRKSGCIRDGIVKQVNLDLQSEFPDAKGFDTTNLWYMKKWYQFYANETESPFLQQLVGEMGGVAPVRLEQVGNVESPLDWRRNGFSSDIWLYAVASPR